jgi:hypothetical protein
VSDDRSSNGMVDLNDGLEILSKFRQRLLDIKKRLLEIEARFEYFSAAAERLVTLREFTEKYLNDKGPNDQEANSSNPRAAATKYSTG